MRMHEMESRIMGLEEQLAIMMDELRQARSREMGMASLAREMIGFMAGKSILCKTGLR